MKRSLIQLVRIKTCIALSVIVVVTGSGCCCGRGHRVHIPHWKFWERKTYHSPVIVQPTPVYPLYDSMPGMPAPGSVLPPPEPVLTPAHPGDGIRVPAPEFESEELPAPKVLKEGEKLPAPPSLLDQGRRQGRPPLLDSSSVPRMAERPTFDRQPVGLDHPEVDDDESRESIRPAPIQSLDPSEDEVDFAPNRLTLPPAPEDVPEPEEEDLDSVRPSSHGTGGLPRPIPHLSDPESSGSQYQEASYSAGVPASSTNQPEKARSKILPPKGFHIHTVRLARDERFVAADNELSADSLQRGQHLVAQIFLKNVRQVFDDGEYVSRITCNLDVRDVNDKVLTRTKREYTYERTKTPTTSRTLMKWITIPTDLKPGKYGLRMKLKDDIAKVETVKTYILTIH